jgi:hypothetical protein
VARRGCFRSTGRSRFDLIFQTRFSRQTRALIVVGALHFSVLLLMAVPNKSLMTMTFGEVRSAVGEH